MNRHTVLSLLAASGLAQSALADAPALTPQQLIDEVRAQEAARGRDASLLTPVPGIADVAIPPARLARPAPTVQDKVRLEAELKQVNSALKIRDVTDRSIQHASDTIAAQGQMLFTYAPGGIYEVQAAPFHETAIELQPGETLTGKELPTAGDTARWTIAATRSGSSPNESVVLIVKPLEADLETNMTITTNRRLYTVILKSTDHIYMPLVGWLYPQDDARAQEQRDTHEKKVESEAEQVTVSPDALNFNCNIAGSHVAWRPLRVYDDGTKTYLQMSPDMQVTEAPAIFVMDGKTPLVVNFRVKHSIYIIDRLFEHAQLRIGPKTAVDVSCVHQFVSR